MLQAADFSRALAEREREQQAAVRGLLLDFLDVLDAVDRLLRGGGGATRPNLRALRRQLVTVFNRHGVRFFSSRNQPFDPERHEAVEARVDPAQVAGTVVDEVRAGCEWNGELLRTAHAVVVREP
jgi:molecular chaperone GrpE